MASVPHDVSVHAVETAPYVHKLSLMLEHDDRRVITLPFFVRMENNAERILERVNALSEEDAQALLQQTRDSFRGRHQDLDGVFREHFELVARRAGITRDLSEVRRLLIGSYFTMEYSIESAALFNPSMVLHPDQEGVAEGNLRFLMSLRATGEGHVSSIVFRSGAITADNAVQLDELSSYTTRTRLAPDQYYLKSLFRDKLAEMTVRVATADYVLKELPEKFTYAQLERAITTVREARYQPPGVQETVNCIMWLARSNYQLKLPQDTPIRELVIYPQSESESRGVEDLRLVRFTEDDGSVMYYGTYSAYDGMRVMPMMIETADFRDIQIHTLNGACAQNKGMALFPRKIDGHYCMCSRIDGQNLHIMFSDYLHFWETAELLAEPVYPWEMMLIGNCGSPIETDEGWLLLTHGVGPMRRYCIGAMLLDRDDPLQVRGRLREPLMVPSEQEREGYVPNVVYSCGGVLHEDRLILPYAMSDKATGMATMKLSDLLDQLLN